MSGEDEDIATHSAPGRQNRRQLLQVGEGIRQDGRSRSPPELPPGLTRASSLFGEAVRTTVQEEATAAAFEASGSRAQPLDSGIVAEIMKFKDKDTQSALKKLVLKLVDQIETLQKVNERIATTSKQEEELRENRVPSGVKPFSTSFTNKYLDTLTLNTDLKMELTVPSGTTIHEAKKLLYTTYIMNQKKLDIVLLQKQRAELRECTALRAFEASCSAIPRYVAPWLTLDLDLDAEHVAPLVDEAKILAAAKVMYYKAVDQVATKKVKAQTASETMARNKEKVVEKMITMKPSELFNKAVEAQVKVAVNKDKQSSKAKDPSQPSADVYAVGFKDGMTRELIEQHMPKHDLPAHRPVGKAQAKSKAKAKGRSVAEARGTAKAKPKAKPKAKATAPAATTNQYGATTKAAKGKGKGKGKGAGGKGSGKGTSYGKGKGKQTW